MSLGDFNEAVLNDAKKNESEFPGFQLLTVAADASNEEHVKNYVNIPVKKNGTSHDVYNNVGIEGRQASSTDYDLNIFKGVININLIGVYCDLRYVNPVMRKPSMVMLTPEMYQSLKIQEYLVLLFCCQFELFSL